MAKRIQKITLDGLTQRTLNFGYTGENEHTQIRINCAAIFWDYPDAEYSMVVQPPVGDLYNVTLTKDGAYLVWDVTLDDLMYSGGGQFQLTFTDSGEIIKTTIGSFNINRSLDPFGQGNLPSPLENWKQDIETSIAGKIAEPDNEGTSGQVLATDGNGSRYWKTVSGGGGGGGAVDDVQVNGTSIVSSGIANITNAILDAPVSVSGSTPSITAVSGMRYVCGEVSELTITVPASGIIDVVFESGSTPTVLTITPPTGVTIKWANGFDPTSLDANTTYEINIMDGEFGVVGQWT